MKSKLLIASFLTIAVATSNAHTHPAVSDKGNSAPNAVPVALPSAGECLYANKAIKLGDTLIVSESNIVLVCASGMRGPVFYSLAPEAVKRVIAASTK